MSNEPKAGMNLDPETMAAYIDQRLTAEQRAAIEAQLASDPDGYAVLVETMKALNDEAVGAVDVTAPSSFESPGVKVVTLAPWAKRAPMLRWVIAGGALAAAAALVATVRFYPNPLQLLPGDPVDARLERLVAAVGAERYTEGRLSGGFHYGPLRMAVRGSKSPGQQNLAVVALGAKFDQLREASQSVETIWASGIAKILIGEADGAIELLEAALRIDGTNAALMSDLSAAHVTRYRRSLSRDDLNVALQWASRAAAAAPDLSEAVYNRALAAELLGLSEAREYWQQAVIATSSPDWKADAQGHLDGLQRR